MHDWSELFPLVLMILVTGAFAGFIAGLLGVGGGIVLVPAFYFIFLSLGYPSEGLMQLCLATSLATIIVTSLRSLMSHNKKGSVDWRVLREWGPGIAVGSGIGVAVASGLRSDTLMVIFGTLGVLIGLYMAFGNPLWRLGEALPRGGFRLSVAPGIGFLSVLMGIGGGSFGVPLMTLYGHPIHRAVATAAGFGAIIAVPSTLAFLFFGSATEPKPPLTIGSVNLIAFGLVVSMTMLTAPLGARLAHRLEPKTLKRVFAVFIILMAANMLRRALAL